MASAATSRLIPHVFHIPAYPLYFHRNPAEWLEAILDITTDVNVVVIDYDREGNPALMFLEGLYVESPWCSSVTAATSTGSTDERPAGSGASGLLRHRRRLPGLHPALNAIPC